MLNGGGVRPAGKTGGGIKFNGGGVGGGTSEPDEGWYMLFDKFKLYKLGGGGKYPLLTLTL